MAAGIYTGGQDVHGFESWTERPMSEIYRRHIVCRIGLKTIGAVLSKHEKVIIEMSMAPITIKETLNERTDSLPHTRGGLLCPQVQLYLNIYVRNIESQNGIRMFDIRRQSNDCSIVRLDSSTTSNFTWILNMAWDWRAVCVSKVTCDLLRRAFKFIKKTCAKITFILKSAQTI